MDSFRFRQHVEGQLPLGLGQFDHGDRLLERLQHAPGVLERAGLLDPRRAGEDDLGLAHQRPLVRVDQGDKLACEG